MADTINWAKDANENLGKALSGNKEAQKAYNDALKEGLPVEDAFNEALAKITDEQERADVVAKFLNDTYGDSKKTYDDMAGSILDANEAELKLKETQAKLGETMSPINTALTNLKNQALEAITPLVEKLADGFMKLYEWLQKNPVAMQIITGVVIALATAFTVLAGALAIQGLITGVTKAFAFLNTTLLANPITLIIALIAGLVAGFIYLWNNCESFRNFWIKLWEKIQSATKKVVDALKKFFTVTLPNALQKLVTWFKSLPEKIRSAISSMVEKVKTVFNNMKDKAVNIAKNLISSVVNFFKSLPGKIRSAISGAISTVASWGSSMLSTAKSAISKVVNGITSTFKKVVSKVKSIGSDLVRGVWNGISDKIGWIKSKISGFKDAVLKALKSVFGIKSPSRLMKAEVGTYLAEGIAEGMVDSDAPTKAINSVKNNILDGVGEINGATINRKLTTTFNAGSAELINDNMSLLGKLDSIYERLNRLQIVLDTGTLVGETIEKIDAGLANRQTLSARGV